ncbi:prepilin-type N-terminal cleavage/methylation domain-containing protein [Fibrobacter sp. UWEL]|uniref:type IV pilus modification PilV family protein n=1 Tax=Fibrobacter sp. UWEL TaxID=1896209 RepID=UPI000920014B|nr:prepilin-type N-terminal cleavage/methylation domain-containing protein [Fibrobacter sp. UWEL]SHL36692.1 prepilin-type N-terminal cleavage/methylation domain-containing protein [Fibrobacter sp. UWEL]
MKRPAGSPHSSRGFTLMEVFVASAVLSIGVAALSSIYVNFNNQRRLEIQAVDAYICSVSAMEQLLQTPPLCGLPSVKISGRVPSGNVSSGGVPSGIVSSGDVPSGNVSSGGVPTNRPCTETTVLLSPIPGVSRLTIAAIPMAHDVTLRRLLTCK